MNNIKFYDDSIVICPSYMKKEIIKLINLKCNVKIYTPDELKDKYLYTYKNNTMVYMDNKYNLIPENSKIILNNLYEIDINSNYNNDKLNTLVSIKKDLIENKYIVSNNGFRNYIKNKKIIVIEHNYDSLTKFILSKLDNIIYEKVPSIKKTRLIISKYKSLNDEVVGIASKIVKLVNSGVNINNIKISRPPKEYEKDIIRIFGYYNIPISIKSNSLYTLMDVKKFLNSLSNNIEILSINDILNNLSINEKIKEKLIDILNKYVDYTFYNEIEKEFLYDLKNTNIQLHDYTNVIKIIDYKNYLPNDDEYIFIIGMNQDVLPKIYKDDEYLTDKELILLNKDTSSIKNIIETNTLIDFINNTKNIYISYKLKSDTKEYAISSFINNFNYEIFDEKYSYDNDKINKLLLSSKLDKYIKYNEYDQELFRLYSYYTNNDYMSYKNAYNKISYNTIKKELNNKINLSYTNTNTFFRCKFRFLLDTIYKLLPYEETLSQRIGNLFHEVLYKIYKDNTDDYDNIINETIDDYFKSPSKKDSFYIKKYKEALIILINNLNEQLDKTEYKNEYFEEWFSIEKDNDLEVKIVGKIDKILTLKDDKNTYVIVVDYKTGGLHGDFNKVVYGLDMQLIYYLYLIKNTKKIIHPKFTGMYLQSIMFDVLSKENNKTYNELLKNNMKLYGYTTNNLSYISRIDKDYELDSYIKGLKVKKDGSFYSYSKVLSNDDIDKLIAIVDNNLCDVIKAIKESDFSINPKKIGNDLVGCEYCKFKDICYMSNNDIVDLEVIKNLEFLGGDDSDTKET